MAKIIGNFTIKKVGSLLDAKYNLFDGNIRIATSLNASKQEKERLIQLAKDLQESKEKGNFDVYY